MAAVPQRAKASVGQATVPTAPEARPARFGLAVASRPFGHCKCHDALYCDALHPPSPTPCSITPQSHFHLAWPAPKFGQDHGWPLLPLALLGTHAAPKSGTGRGEPRRRTSTDDGL
jgi:hypothetical protein